MTSAELLRAVLSTISGHPLLERLFFASLELAALAGLVWVAIHAARIRSARVVSLLWLVVLAKPIVSLALGSPWHVLELAKPAPPAPAVEQTPETGVASAVEPVSEPEVASAVETATPPLGKGGVGRGAPHAFDSRFTPMTEPGDFDAAPRSEFAGTPAPLPSDATPAPAALPDEAEPTPAVAAEASPAPAVPVAWDLAPLLLSLWLAGVLFFAGRSALDRLRLRRLIRHTTPPGPEVAALFGRLAGQVGSRRPPQVRISEELESPALVGTLFPTILVPDWLATRENANKADWAIRHELMHWRMFDPLASLIREISQTLFYFHPAAWWAGNRWEVAAELACDRAIIRDDADSHDYAAQLYAMLVEIRGRRRSPLRNGLFATRTQIMQRVAALAGGSLTTRAHLSALAIVAVALVSVTALSVGGSFAEKEEVVETVEAPADDAPAVTDVTALVQDRLEDSTDPAAQKPDAARGEEPGDTKSEVRADEVALRGRIVDPKGTPIAGARLYVNGVLRDPVRSKEDIESRLAGTSDAAGRFSVKVRRQVPELTPAEMETTFAFVHYPGMAIHWIDPTSLATTDAIEVVLQPEQVLRGRFLDTEGRPVAGARVFVEYFEAPPGNSLDGLLAAFHKDRNSIQIEWRKMVSRTVPDARRFGTDVRTDADGLAEIHGIPSETVNRVILTGDSIASARLLVLNRRGFDLKPYFDENPNRALRGLFAAHGADFTHVCQPDVVVEGKVQLEDGRPAAGIDVDASGGANAYPARGTSDAEGSYRLAGLARDQRISLTFTPSETSELLPLHAAIQPRAGEAIVRHDARLPRGVVLTGRVTDRSAGTGVSGVSVQFIPLADNEYVRDGKYGPGDVAGRSRPTDSEGRFRVIAIPGSVLLSVAPLAGGGRSLVGDRYVSPFRTVVLSDEEGRRVGRPASPRNFAAAKFLEIAADAREMTIDLEVDRGKTVDVRLVDADGKPVEGAVIAGTADTNLAAAQLTETGCTIYALGADRPRKVIALHYERGLVGAVTLTGDEKSPVELKLGPAATLRGRAVGESGRPIADIEVNPGFGGPDFRQLSELYREIQRTDARTDRDGRFQIRGIIPDEAFILTTTGGGPLRENPRGRGHKLTAGDDQDLGDVIFYTFDRIPPAPPATGTPKTDPASSDPSTIPAESPKAKENETEESAASAEAQANSSQATTNPTITVRGRVVDAGGKPLEGALLLMTPPANAAAAVFTVEPVATAGVDGRFEVSVDFSQYRQLRVARLTLVVTHPGFGLEWLEVTPTDTADARDVLLRPEQPITARFLDTEGRPVPKPKVGIANSFLVPRSSKSLDTYLSVAQVTQEHMRPLMGVANLDSLLPMETGADGRITLHGIPADAVFGLGFSAEDFATWVVTVVSRPGFDEKRDVRAEAKQRILTQGTGARLTGPDFTYTAALDLKIEGRVTSEGGEPVANAAVVGRSASRDNSAAVRTDADGRYRLAGLARGEELTITVRAPAGSNLSDPQPQKITSRVEENRRTLDFELKRAANDTTAGQVIITGRVIDPATGAGVPGRIGFFRLGYDAAPTREPGQVPRRPDLADADGNFRIAVSPGRGLLTVLALGGEIKVGDQQRTPFRRARLSEEDAKLAGPLRGRPGEPGIPLRGNNAARYVDVKPGSEALKIDLMLDRGKTVDLEFVDRAGQPVRDVLISGVVESGITLSTRVAGSRTPVYALGPGLARKVLLLQPEKGLAGSLTLSGDEASPQRVVLEPSASIRGRAVDRFGAAVTEAAVALWLPLFPNSQSEEFYRFANIAQGETKTDEKGRFEIRHLVPGMNFDLRAVIDGKNVLVRLPPDRPPLKPGQTADLGDVAFGASAGGNAQSQAAPERPENEPRSDVSSAQPAGDAKPEVRADEVALRGRIVDPKGAPISGARLYVNGILRDPIRRWGDMEARLIGTSDTQGRFSVKVRKRSPGMSSAEEGTTFAYVHHPGMTLHWIDPAFLTATDGIEIVLRPEQVIRGKLIDTEGRPAAGERVFVEWFEAPQSGSLDGYLAALEKQQGALQIERQKMTGRTVPGNSPFGTDVRSAADGTFELHGIPPESLTHVVLAGDKVASFRLLVLNRRGFDPKPYFEQNPNPQMRAGLSSYGPDFTHVCESAIAVAGRITGEDGRPAAGAEVSGGATNSRYPSSWGRTDAEGRYRLTGIGREATIPVAVHPDETSEFLGQRGQVRAQAGEAVVTHDMQLRRGIVVTGRVTDRVTGAPVAGGFVQIVPETDNEFVRQGIYAAADLLGNRRIDGEGRFRVKSIPGAILLAVTPFGDRIAGEALRTYRLKTFTAEERGRIGRAVPQQGVAAAKFLTLTPGEREVKVDFEVDSGKRVELRVVDPDGKPAPDTVVIGVSEWAAATVRLTDEHCMVYALGSDRPRKVTALHYERGLTGSVTLTGEEASPADLKLVRTASVRGRAIDESGEPIRDADLSVNFVREAGDSSLAQLYFSVERPVLKTDADGRFEVKGLIPGEPFLLWLLQRAERRTLRDNPAGGSHVTAIGQELNLKDVVFYPPGRVPPAAQQSPPKGDAEEEAAAPVKPAADQSAAARPNTASANLQNLPPEIHDAPNDATITIRGRVTDSSGAPCPRARLYTNAESPDAPRDRYDFESRLIGTTEANGRFAVRVSGAALASPTVASPLVVIIHQPGMALHWIDPLAAKEGDLHEVVLQPEQVIRARFVDTEGRPVVGATVCVEGSNVPPPGGSLDAYLAAHRQDRASVDVEQLKLKHRGLPTASPFGTTARTDSDGRVELHGIPPETVNVVTVSADTIASIYLMVLNRQGLDTKPLEASANPGGRGGSGYAGVHSSDFTHVCEAGIAIEGHTTAEGGKPAAGVSVSARAGSAPFRVGETDADGHYRITGLKRNQSIRLLFSPGATSDLLPLRTMVRSQLGDAKDVRFDARLKRGVVVTGRLTDRSTGAPVPGTVRVERLTDNVYINQGTYDASEVDGFHVNTDRDGRYRLTTIPGAVLIVAGASGGRVSVGNHRTWPFRLVNFTAEESARFGRGRITTPFPPVAARFLDLAPAEKEVTVNLETDRGKTIDVRFIDAEGAAVGDVVVSGIADLHARAAQLTESRCTIYALGADRPRRVAALNYKRGLAGSITLTGDEPSPVELKLSRAGSARGRAVNATGQPIREAELILGFVRTGDDLTLRELYEAIERAPLKTDRDGRFEIPCIVPDETFFFILQAEGKSLREDASHRRHTTASGEELNLGDVVFFPPGRVPPEAAEDAPPKTAGERATPAPKPATDKSDGGAATPDNLRNPKSEIRNSGEAATVTYRGRVVDPAGKPAVGARVVIVGPPGSAVDFEPLPLAGEAKTGADGRFEIAYGRSRFEETARRLGFPSLSSITFVASQPGLGLAWRSSIDPTTAETNLKPEDEITLKLVPDDAPLAGRVLDLEGQPLAGVTVAVHWLYESRDGDIGPWLRAIEAGEQEQNVRFRLLTFPPLANHLKDLPDAVTDAQGRFRIVGIGRDRLVVLRLQGPTIAATELYAMTRRMKGLDMTEVPAVERAPRQVRPLYGVEFDVVAQPTQPVQGVVRDAQTRKPLAGMMIASSRMAGTAVTERMAARTVSDEAGRYRLIGMPKGDRNEIFVIPPRDEPYFVQTIPVANEAGLAPVNIDIEMGRGIWITGRAIDRATGEAVPANVQYLPFRTNEFAQQRPYEFGVNGLGGRGQMYMRSRESRDGTFRVLGLPGRGVLTANGRGEGYRIGFGADKIEGLGQPPGYRGLMGTNRIHHALREINPPEGAESITSDIELERSETIPPIRVAVVDPDGKPVAGCRVEGHTSPRGAGIVDGATFDVAELAKDSMRTLVIRHEGRNLGKVVAIPVDANTPRTITVQVEPLALVKGRVLQREGEPAAGVTLQLVTPPPGGVANLTQAASQRRNLGTVVTDDAGRFEIKGVPSGADCVLMGEIGPAVTDAVGRRVTPKPGETLDVGDLRPAGDGAQFQMNQRLASGKLTGEVLGPEGKPLPRATLRGTYATFGRGELQQAAPTATADANGKFDMTRMATSLWLFVADADGKLAGRVKIEPQQDSVTLRLAPAASAIGRLLDGEKPLAKVTLHATVSVDMTGVGGQTFPQQATVSTTVTGADGRFTCTGLIPEVEYAIALPPAGGETPLARLQGGGPRVLAKFTTTKAGEATDLGTVRAEAQPPPANGNAEATAAAPKAAPQANPPAGAGAAADPNFRNPQSEIRNAADADTPVDFSGSVVDHEGKPVAGAAITVSYLRQTPAPAGARPAAVSDAAGKFHFTAKRSELADPSNGPGFAFDAGLLAVKEGFGFAYGPAVWFETTGRLDPIPAAMQTDRDGRWVKRSDVLTLVPDDVPIRGRVLDIDGRPIAGATIRAVSVFATREGSLDSFEAAVVQPNADFAQAWRPLRKYCEGYLNAELMNRGGGPNGRSQRLFSGHSVFTSGVREFVPAVRSDAEGRFVLKGLGRERVVEFVVSGPGIETATGYLRTRRAAPARLSWGSGGSFGDLIVHPSEFDLVCGPSAAVEGRVADDKTGKPLAGFHVQSSSVLFVRSTSDADGRYRLEGLPPGRNGFLILPPAGSRYLPGSGVATIESPTKPTTRDVSLTEGVLLRGRVFDETTQEPRTGIIQYGAFRTNPHLPRSDSFKTSTPGAELHQVGSDGRFEFAILPGPGIVGLRTGGDYPLGVGVDRIEAPQGGAGRRPAVFDTLPMPVRGQIQNLVVAVDPKPGDAEATVSLGLRSQAGLRGRALSPDGKPLGTYFVVGANPGGVWYPATETFDVRGYSPEQQRRLTIYDPEHDLAGVFDLSGPQPESLEIKLRPAGTLVGRILDADGQPLENAWLDGGSRPAGGGAADDDRAGGLAVGRNSPLFGKPLPLTTDDKGRFEIKGIVPGEKYDLRVRVPEKVGNQTLPGRPVTLFTDLVCEPGETKQLGDLRVKPADDQQRDDAKPQEAPKTEPKEAPKANPPAAPGAAAADPNFRNPKSEIRNAADPTFEFAGTVVDPDGKPVAGAALRFDYWRLEPVAADAPPEGVTNARGEFRFSRKKSRFDDAGGDDKLDSVGLTAFKEGFGLAGDGAAQFETTGEFEADRAAHRAPGSIVAPKPKVNVLKLVADDVPIRWRVVNSEGRPVADAKIEALGITEAVAGTLDAWEAATKEPGANGSSLARHVRQIAFGNSLKGPLSAVVPPVRTDADGWATLKGVGRDRLADVLISGPGIETAMVKVRTRRGEVLRLASDPRATRETTYFPAEFTRVAGPSVPVEGRVIDGRTKQPVAGILVRAHQLATGASGMMGGAESIRAVSGPDGRYRLEGLPVGKNLLALVPPDGSRFFFSYHPITTDAAAARHVEDLPLTAGVLVKGRVTDTRTGVPVAGLFRYFPFQMNPHRPPGNSLTPGDGRRNWADADGRFAIPVLPGPGILTFSARPFWNYPLGAGADRIDGPRYGGSMAGFATSPICFVAQYNLLTALDPAPGTEELTLDLTVTSGVSVPCRVLSPEGQPLSGVHALGLQSSVSWRQYGSAFEIEGYFPAKGRRLMFYHPPTNLAGLYDLTGEPPAVLDITLQPAATLTGRLVNADGEPIENVLLNQPLVVFGMETLEELKAGALGVLLTPLEGKPWITDSRGRFEIKGIVPGLKYSVQARSQSPIAGPLGRSYGPAFTDVVAGPGETKDLGDLRPK